MMAPASSSLIVLSLFAVFGYNRATIYQEYTLQNYCSNQINLLCPTNSSGSSGTLRFSYPPTLSTCAVNITVANCSVGSNLKIYFNIKKSVMPPSDSISIYENTTYSRNVLVKSLDGTSYQYHNPSSVAQLLSSSSPNPAFSIQYKKSPFTGTFDNVEVVFDYTILLSETRSYNDYNYRYCSALSGYVQKDYFCDGCDRVNCPASYRTDTYLNPVLRRDYYCSDCHDGSSVGVIVGAVVGSIVFVIVCIAIAAAVRRHRIHYHHHHDPCVTTTTYGATTVVPGATVVGPQGQYPPAYPQPYVGAPAGYAPPTYQGPQGVEPYPAAIPPKV